MDPIAAVRNSVPRSVAILLVALCIVPLLLAGPKYLLLFTAAVLFFFILGLHLNSAIYVLLLLSLFSFLSLDVGPVTIRPDQVFALSLFVILATLIISGKRPFIKTRLDFWIILYLLI